MLGPHKADGDLRDSREKRIGEILRSSGLPLGMAMLRYVVTNGTARIQELSDNLGYSVHSCRTTMGKMQKLGLFVKSGTFSKGVVYDLTHEGIIVANCIKQLVDINSRETKQSD